MQMLSTTKGIQWYMNGPKYEKLNYNKCSQVNKVKPDGQISNSLVNFIYKHMAVISFLAFHFHQNSALFGQCIEFPTCMIKMFGQGI